jgi:hypothetical protein
LTSALRMAASLRLNLSAVMGISSYAVDWVKRIRSTSRENGLPVEGSNARKRLTFLSKYEFDVRGSQGNFYRRERAN